MPTSDARRAVENAHPPVMASVWRGIRMTAGSPARMPKTTVRGEAGFSLIELLVVLVILAVLATVVGLSVTGVASRQLENQAQRLKALLTLACEQSVMTGREVGLRMASAQWEFVYFSGESWVGVEQLTGVERAPLEALRLRALDEGVQWRIERDGEALSLDEVLPEMPQWVCFDSGEMTALDLWLTHADVDTEWHLQAHANGEILLESNDVSP